ncbi:hypothetical protein LXA43DRAFT_595198 [Ganoderma leucocontextum]|nr:hypothetical protein LXA43DRAFT_595198 [Ganoderma leucocontextum]
MVNLARTSKLLRSIVLAKSSRSAWIASLATVDTLPSCPDNMSEPLYAALLFDRHCFLCGSDHAKWVDYAIRLRLCKTCYKANIRKGSAILDEANAYMLSLVPCETSSDLKKAQKFASPENRTGGNKYYAPHVNATVNVIVTHLYAVIILAWFREKSLLKELANKVTMSDRKSKITERLQELGYTEIDFPEGEEAWDRLMDQPKPLTDRSTFPSPQTGVDIGLVWNNIHPKLEEQLTIEKERKALEAFDHRVDHRLDGHRAVVR